MLNVVAVGGLAAFSVAVAVLAMAVQMLTAVHWLRYLVLILLSIPFVLFTLAPWLLRLLAMAIPSSPLLLRDSAKYPAVLRRMPFSWTSLVEARHRQRQISSPSELLPFLREWPMAASALEKLMALVMRDYVWSWYSRVVVVPALEAASDASPTLEASPGDRLFYKIMESVNRSIPKLPPPIQPSRDPYAANLIEMELRRIVMNLQQRLELIDPVPFLTQTILPILQSHVMEYKRALMVVNQSGRRHLAKGSDFDMMVASAYRQGRLHPALGGTVAPRDPSAPLLSSNLPADTLPFELAYLREMIQTKLFPVLLPSPLLCSRIVVVLLREVLACCILQPAFKYIMDPDYWNQTIDIVTTQAITEQKMIKKLREALDRPFTILDEPENTEMDSQIFGTSSKTHLPTFEEYLRHIKDCQNLLDAKRIRNALVTEIRKKRLQIMDKRDKDLVNGQRVEDIKKYINRLTVAKRRSEKRILQLGGTLYFQQQQQQRAGGGNTLSVSRRPSAKGTPALVRVRAKNDSSSDIAGNEVAALGELLREPGLTYFREFLEQEKRPSLLEFWLTMEALKGQYLDPLTVEAMGGDVPVAIASLFDCSEEKALQLEHLLNADLQIVYEKFFDPKAKWAASVILEDRDLDGIRQHYEMLLSLPRQAEKETYRTLLATILGLVLRVQNEIFQYMEETMLPRFFKSDPYVRLLSDPTFTNPPVGETPPRSRKPSVQSEKPIVKTFGKTMSYLENMLKKRINGTNESTSSSVTTSGSSAGTEKLTSPSSRTLDFLRSMSPSRIQNLNLPNIFHRDSSLDVLLENEDVPAAQSSAPSVPRIRVEQEIAILPSVDEMTQDPQRAEDENDAGILDDDAELVEKIGEERDLHLLTSDAVEAVEEAFRTMNEGSADLSRLDVEGSGELNESETDEEEEEDEDEEDLGEDGEDDERDLQTLSGSIDSPPMQDHLDTTSDAPQSDSATLATSQNEMDRVLVESAQQRLERVKQQMDILRQQEALLDLMFQKTKREVTDPQSSSAAQWNVLEKTKLQFEQDLQALEFQKVQLELQLNSTKLFAGQLAVSVSSWATGEASIANTDVASGSVDVATADTTSIKPFVVYLIEVTDTTKVGSGWMIARRYSEFFTLHRRLKNAFPGIMARPGFEIPGKRIFHHLTSAARMKSGLTDSGGSGASSSASLPPISPFDKRERKFIEERKQSLEKYLQTLSRDETILNSWEFRQFLSLSSDFNKSSKKNMGVGIVPSLRRRISGFLVDNPLSTSTGVKKKRLNSLPSVSLVDMISQKFGQAFHRSDGDTTEDALDTQDERETTVEDRKMESRRSSVPALQRPRPELKVDPFASRAVSPSDELTHDMIRGEIEQSLKTSIRPADLRPQTPLSVPERSSRTFGTMFMEEASTSAGSVAEPLSDLFVEIFELKEKNNWLRRQAVLLILQQIFGGAIERRFTELTRWCVSEEMWTWYIQKLHETLSFYSDPENAKAWKPRTEQERQQTKVAAFKKLQFYLPDMLGPMVGRANAKRGTTRVFDVLQNERLNLELLYRILDEVVLALISVK